VKKEDGVDVVGGGVAARRESLDDATRCVWECMDGSRTLEERLRFVVEEVKKLMVGRRPGAKDKTRPGVGRRREGFIAAMMLELDM